MRERGSVRRGSAPRGGGGQRERGERERDGAPAHHPAAWMSNQPGSGPSTSRETTSRISVPLGGWLKASAATSWAGSPAGQAERLALSDQGPARSSPNGRRNSISSRYGIRRPSRVVMGPARPPPSPAARSRSGCGRAPAPAGRTGARPRATATAPRSTRRAGARRARPRRAPRGRACRRPRCRSLVVGHAHAGAGGRSPPRAPSPDARHRLVAVRQVLLDVPGRRRACMSTLTPPGVRRDRAGRRCGAARRPARRQSAPAPP